MEENRLFLVKICSDLRIQRLLWRPVTMIGFDEHGAVREVQLIEKTMIICDTCGARVAVTERDLDEGLPMGYALCDEECIIEVVCEDRRRRYFKHLIDGVEIFLDLLNDPETDFRVKLMDYAKTRADVAEFCRYYAKWLGEPIMERLKHEVNKVLEKAITCWDQQEVFNVMEGVL